MRTKLFTLIALVILVTGALTYGRARWRAASPPNPLSSGFTIQYVVKHDVNLSATSTRYVKSNGEFLETTNYLNPDGSSNRQTKLAGTLAHGAVFIDDAAQKLNYAGHADIAHQVMSEEKMRADPYFIREDSLLGQRVYVTTDCIGAPAARRCAEHWQARDLGGELLKMVIVDDGQVITVKEATRIDFGEPSFVVPNYPVDTAKYEDLKKKRTIDR